MLKKLLFLLLFISICLGCTKDDICAQATPTTPMLIITFKDFNNRLEFKPVIGLTVRTAELNSKTVVNNITTDSIAIPLRNGEDHTLYRFIREASVDEAGDPNNDLVNFTYVREDVYVNRACSFKTIYGSLNQEIEDEGNGFWIQDILTLKPIVEDETEAHVVIYH